MDGWMDNQHNPCLHSLIIPLWVGTKSTGDGLGHHYARNSEFCVTVGPDITTAG